MTDTIRPGRRPERSEPRVLVHFLMERADVDALDDLAWEQRTTKSELLRQMVKRELRVDRTP